MRIMITVVADHDEFDVIVDAAPETSLMSLGFSLGEWLGARADVTASGARIESHGNASTSTVSSPPSLFLGKQALDPASLLGGGLIVDGSIVRVGYPTFDMCDSGLVDNEQAGLVELRIVGGMATGQLFRVGIGNVTIGADDGCDVVVRGGPNGVNLVVAVDLSGQAHVRCSADEFGVTLEGEPLLSLTSMPWREGGQVRFGHCVLEVHRVAVADAVIERGSDNGWRDFNRPPRMLPPELRATYRLPSEPKMSPKSAFPWLAVALPAVLGVTMALLLKQPIYLLLAFASPLLLVANSITNSRQGKKSHRRLTEEHRVHITAVEDAVAESLEVEKLGLRRASPDAASLFVIATGPMARLWERRRTDADHLRVRVGIRDLPSQLRLEDLSEMEHRQVVTRLIRDVPVTISIPAEGVIGIAGLNNWSNLMARWLVGQLAVLQSPRDLQIYVLTEASAVDNWAWTRWLPHSRPILGQDALSLIGTDPVTLGARLSELLELVASRHAARKTNPASSRRTGQPDILVVLDGARRLRSLPGLVTVLSDGPEVGIFSMCLDTDEHMLPEECATTLVEGPNGQAVLRQQRLDVIDDILPDAVHPSWFEPVSRHLSSLRDSSPGFLEEGLPASARLLDVLGLELPTPERIMAHWLVSPRSTEFVAGLSLNGALKFDLVRDGPHALIGGTTGSGKSELLQTLVAALAVANRPDAMTFVLIDYKGGAAFKDCVDLPHTVGMVTDLDSHLVERALASLGAELTRREHVLASVGAKDLEDYLDFIVKLPESITLPRLVIVIDEFASMARELPDFMAGLVNIAQRGRSLGIHLILATQRPSGVISPEIRANTNLRIALRVTDTSDSMDILDAPDAARISKDTPGRAYVRLGHTSLLPFQTARVGGRRPGIINLVTLQEPFIAHVEREALGRSAPQAKVASTTVLDEVTDLSVLVGGIRSASETLGVPRQHSPWLPALPISVTLPLLGNVESVTDGEGIPLISWAIEDRPKEQAQRPARFDMATFGHLLVVGSPGSGRSQALRTISVSSALHVSSADLHVYGLDCGNGSLLALTRLPHCGAIVQRVQTERAVRLIERLRLETIRRQEIMGVGGYANVTEQRAGSEQRHQLPHVLVMIDRWEGFTSTFADYDGGVLIDHVLMLLREGASVGVHLIIAGDRSLLSGRIGALVDDKLILRLADPGDYSLAGLNYRQISEQIPVGRGFRVPGAVETQVCLLGQDASGTAQAGAIEALAITLRDRERFVIQERKPFRVDVLPVTLSMTEAWQFPGSREDGSMWAMIGVGGDDLLAVGADLESDAATFVVAGPARSGKSTLLTVMASSLLRNKVEIVIAAPRPSPLRLLAGRPGVRAVFCGADLTESELAPLLEFDTKKVVLIVDDGEVLRDVSCKEWLRDFVRVASGNCRALILGGNSSELAGGFSGWQVEAKKNQRGALLSPQGVTDGDLAGVRLSRSMLVTQVTPGRALVHLGNGQLTTIQVPAAPD